MFAKQTKHEYDPASAPVVDRPLAAGRPLTSGSQPSKPEETDATASPPEAYKDVPTSSAGEFLKPGQQSPTKSSLSKNTRYGHAFDPENGIWSEDDDSINDRQLPPGKSLHRHAKSVTFDAAPPQVNEYEMTTPDPSSVASGSRDGSYDSGEDDEDESFEREFSADPEDSFDASLEDTEKTPVVLPEDWRFMSPDTANDELTARLDDPFGETGEMKASTGATGSPKRTDSVNSNGERRPLPPLPPDGVADSETGDGISTAAERGVAMQRNLPASPRPASISKAELQSMGASSMSLEDRLRLMMVQENEKSPKAKTFAEEQRERRLRRGQTDRSPDKQNLGSPKGDEMNLPPRISRESILRKVQSKTFVDDLDIDPDTPLPSLEEQPLNDSDEKVSIKQEEDTEVGIDLHSIPTQNSLSSSGPAPSDSDQEPATDDDGESHYSTDSKGQPINQEDLKASHDNAPPTPRAAPAVKASENGDVKRNHRLSFPQFSSMLGEDDFGLSLSNYMTPMSSINEPVKAPLPATSPGTSTAPAARPRTPLNPSRLYDGSGYGNDEDYDDPGTPESVIRRSITPPSEPEPEPEPIPEPVATIKSSGGMLKTRASLAPADAKAMAETRRQVSGESAKIPPIPERSYNRPSVIPEADSFMPENSFGEEEVHGNGKFDKRRSSLVPLDVSMAAEDVEEGLSMGLDKEFDRLIEAKKVSCIAREIQMSDIF
jgi:hypothetical protein